LAHGRYPSRAALIFSSVACDPPGSVGKAQSPHKDRGAVSCAGEWATNQPPHPSSDNPSPPLPDRGPRHRGAGAGCRGRSACSSSGSSPTLRPPGGPAGRGRRLGWYGVVWGGGGWSRRGDGTEDPSKGGGAEGVPNPISTLTRRRGGGTWSVAVARMRRMSSSSSWVRRRAAAVRTASSSRCSSSSAFSRRTTRSSSCASRPSGTHGGAPGGGEGVA